MESYNQPLSDDDQDLTLERPVRVPVTTPIGRSGRILGAAIDALGVVALLLWAAAVRLFALQQPQRIVWGDEPAYLWLGRNWLTGQGYGFMGFPDVHHSPGYPLLSGLAYLLTNNLEVASNVCYLVFGVLLVIPVYLLAREMYGKQVAFVSALLLGIYPAISTAPVFWGTFTEPPYYFFVYAGLLFMLLAMRRERLLPYFVSGACFGFAYLIRPEAVAYLAVCGFVVALVRLFEKRFFRRVTWVGFALYLVGFLLFFLPYVYYVYRETGAWMVSEKAGVTFVTCIGLSEGDTADFDRATWGLDSTGREVFFFSRESYHVSMWDVIRAYPSEFIQLVVRNSRRFISSLLSLALFSYYLLPLLGVAFFRAAWDKRRVKGELLLLGSLLPVLVFLLFFIQDRYIATLLPTLVVWLGLGTYELGVWLKDTVANLLGPGVLGRVWRGVLLSIPTLVLVVFFAVLQPKVVRQYANTGSFRPEHKKVGLWLRDNTPSNAVVMSRYSAIAFYAERRWKPLPNATYAELMTYARANDVSYFVLDQLETRELRPQYAALLYGEVRPADLRLIHVDESPTGKLVVFQIR